LSVEIKQKSPKLIKKWGWEVFASMVSLLLASCSSAELASSSTYKSKSKTFFSFPNKISTFYLEKP
jgi:hypothetical protein